MTARHPPVAPPAGSAFDSAAIGMALIAPDSRRLRVNQAFCDLLGYTSEELLALSLDEISHPDDVAEGRRLRTRILGNGEGSYQREKRFVHKSGRVVWGLVTCTLVSDSAGQPLHFMTQTQDITERKLAEQALRESEDRFHSLSSLSAEGYWEMDASFRFIDFSGSVLVGTGPAERAAALGKRPWELDGTYPVNATWAEHRSLLDKHLPFRDFQYMRVVGEAPPRYLSASGDPVFDANGELAGYRGTARDITDSELTVQRLRDAEAMLHMAARIGRLGAWAHELSQPNVNWSQEVCVIHEVPSGFAPTQEQVISFFAPDYQDAMRSIVRACEDEGAPFDVEAPIITAKGRRVWTRVIGEADRDADGRIRRLQGACQDISESKQAAEDARLIAAQLTTTLESLTDAFFTLDRDWRFTYVNGEAERLLRAPRSALLGRVVWDEFPRFRGTDVQTHFENALAGNLVVQFDKHEPAQEIWSQVKAYPSGQGLAIYIRDITQRMADRNEILRFNAELEQRVRQRTAQLQEANRELESFAYSIAHDLRAPLSTIEGFSRMLESAAGAVLEGRARHYLNRIRAGVRQMGELTEALLALASLSRASMRSETVDLAVLARSAIGACRERDPTRPVEVHIAPVLPAMGDSRLLSQVMVNLVENAWKFTSKRAGARIDIGSMLVAQEVVYFVRDNGAGFAMEHAEKMFEAFHRMHSAVDFEGTGVGLAIVQKIVLRHGGRIWAEAALEQGASFYFALGTGST